MTAAPSEPAAGILAHTRQAITGLAGAGPSSSYHNSEIDTCTWRTELLFVDVLLDAGTLYIHAQRPGTNHYLLCAHIHDPSRAAVDSALHDLAARAGL